MVSTAWSSAAADLIGAPDGRGQLCVQPSPRHVPEAVAHTNITAAAQPHHVGVVRGPQSQPLLRSNQYTATASPTITSTLLANPACEPKPGYGTF